MYRIGICDDEEIYRSIIAKYINDISVKSKIELQIYQYSSGEQIKKEKLPDVLILDIEMERMDGLQVRNLLEQSDSNTLILFCTSHDEFMCEAYGENVVGFIRKPIEESELERKLLYAIGIVKKRKKCVCFNTTYGITQFKISDIVYVQADGRYAKVYTLDGGKYFITDMGISQVYEILRNMSFAKISRGVIVNFENLSSTGDEIIMINGVRLKCSRRMKKQVETEFLDYMCKVATMGR